MEFTIRTMMIVVLGLIVLILLITIFSASQSQGWGIIEGLFDWFKTLGGGT